VQSRRLSVALVVGAIAVAVVLFVVLRDDDGSDSGSTPTAGRTQTTTTTTGGRNTTPTPTVTRIVFRDGGPVGGARAIQVVKGDPVRVDVKPDVPAEVHIHGYDLTKEVDADQTAKFEFKATLDGVFEMELHRLVDGHEESGVPVAELTVTP
jgi:hypothetical protein